MLNANPTHPDMAGTKLPVELSLEADKDLENIFDYTVQQFGLDQAVIYVSSFEQVFENLSLNTKLGRERKEIRDGLRSVTKESHVVFYHILKDRLRIVRILHVSRDVIKFFPPFE